MFIIKPKYSIWIRAISLAVACLFLVNDLTWAGPFQQKSATLAPPDKMADPVFKEEVAAWNYRLATDGVKKYIDESILGQQGHVRGNQLKGRAIMTPFQTLIIRISHLNHCHCPTTTGTPTETARMAPTIRPFGFIGL